jgi:hypothetical protein
VGGMENQIRKYAREFFNMKKGEKIADPQEMVPVSPTTGFTRRSLKHFVESRVAQGSSWSDINYLLKKVGEVTENPQLKIRNPNQRNYPGSTLLGSFYEDKKKAVIVILDKGRISESVVTLYFTKGADFFELLKESSENK